MVATVSPESFPSASSPLLRNTVALHAALGLTSLLLTSIFGTIAGSEVIWLLPVLMGCILAGSWALQRRLVTSIEIDRRLNMLAECGKIRTEALYPVAEADQAAVGWNRLV